jgi:prepilin-type N-terminal cleavage/methylation domain-containing protein
MRTGKVTTMTTERKDRAAGRYELGMTLLEIMIVLAILALVMGFLIGPKVWNMFKESKTDMAKLQAKDYQQAYQVWALKASDPCPSSLKDLQNYRNKKGDKDPWGSEWTMKCGDQAPEGVDFGVTSPGEDKKDGTPDDIKSWED